jgi:homoserine acetyltransferase
MKIFDGHTAFGIMGTMVTQFAVDHALSLASGVATVSYMSMKAWREWLKIRREEKDSAPPLCENFKQKEKDEK